MMQRPAIAFSSFTGLARRACVHVCELEDAHIYVMVNATRFAYEHHNVESTALVSKLIMNLVNTTDLAHPDALLHIMTETQRVLRSLYEAFYLPGGMTFEDEIFATAMIAHITPERARLAWAGDAQAFWLRAADFQDSTVPHIFSQGDANLRVVISTLGAPTAHIDTRDWELLPGDRIVLTRGVEFHRDAELTLSHMLEEQRQEVALELMSSATHQSPRWVGVIVHDV
jgi:hypothetical protein